MREGFEAWIKSRSGSIAKRDGDYLSSMTRYEWLIWQASRQALVVELPHTVYRGDYLQDGTSNLEWEEYYEIDEVKLSLASAGIKWKE